MEGLDPGVGIGHVDTQLGGGQYGSLRNRPAAHGFEHKVPVLGAIAMMERQLGIPFIEGDKLAHKLLRSLVMLHIHIGRGQALGQTQAKRSFLA